MRPASISVVVPTLDGIRTLPPLLDAVRAQTIDGPVEIIAIDSGSTDGTVEILEQRADHVLRVPAADFDHGATRNLAIARASGDLVVLVVQDCLPVSTDWLRALSDPFASDPELAGTFARQEPRPDASAVTRHYLRNWIAGNDRPHRSKLRERSELERAPPIERYRLCAFDNVCSCIRRRIWERFPFSSTSIGEDFQWAREVLLAGFAIAYVPAAAVLHSHDRPARYELARTRTLHHRLYDVFGLRTVPDRPSLLRAVASSLALHVRCQRAAPDGAPRGIREWRRLIALSVAWPLGQYLGGRDGELGRAPRRVRGV